MTPIAAPLLLATLLALTVPQFDRPPPAMLDLCGLTPVFADDFTHPQIAPRRLGPARWTAHTPWNGDFGDAAFADPGSSDDPFGTTADGLRITARRDAGGHWHSGLIAAADASGAGTGVRYGYFEAVMRLPPGPGTWPAFWLVTLVPADDPRPRVEIDAIEYYGHADDAYQVALHTWYRDKADPRAHHTTQAVPVPAGSLLTGFHAYGVRITPREIVWYLDRRAVWRARTPPELAGPLYPLADLALGSGYPLGDTPNPSVLRIKSVAIYRDDATAGPARCGG